MRQSALAGTEVAGVRGHELTRAFIMQPYLDRRRFLVRSGIASTLALGPLPSVFAETSQDFSALDASMVPGLEAVAARILPEDASGPGALSGGVIHFIDKVLGSSREEWQGLLQEGLRELDAQAVRAHGTSFAGLGPTEQDELLHQIENTVFFTTMRTLTLAGMFALPEYGGNRNYTGWQLIGFQHHHVWQPPFGHYDADYMTRGE